MAVATDTTTIGMAVAIVAVAAGSGVAVAVTVGARVAVAVGSGAAVAAWSEAGPSEPQPVRTAGRASARTRPNMGSYLVVRVRVIQFTSWVRLGQSHAKVGNHLRALRSLPG